MNTFIVCDSRNDFQNDIRTSIMLDAYPLEVKASLSFQDACMQAVKYPGAYIILSETVLKNADLSTLPRKAYGYSVTPNGARILQAAGIDSLGLFRTSGDLLEALCNDPLKVVASAPAFAASAVPSAVSHQPKPKPQQAQATRQDPQRAQQGQHQPKQGWPQQGQKPSKERERAEVNTLAQGRQDRPQNAARQPERPAPAPEYEDPAETAAPVRPAGTPVQQPAQFNMQFTPEMMAMMMQMMQQMGMQNTTPPQQDLAQTAPDYSGAANTPMYKRNPYLEPEPEPRGDDFYKSDTYEDDSREEPASSSRAPVSAGTELRGRKRGHDDSTADASIDEDLLAHTIADIHTKVITVYAAKGGVGKTSIATELAVCLALTSNGRRRFRVCIVDYNIDFGDVATTLEFKDDGPNMSYWAAEIREMIERGDDPDSIQFMKAEMEKHYLQQMKDTGLYALCAPVTHEDSMLIKPAELEIMLRNITKNGKFDFVICDTGNNTRDSTIVALDQSEYVLLVATQDVTTANCNASVLRTLQEAGFDTDKVRLVINNAMSSRETGISVQEVEETFSYPCVCRIKHTSDIIKANNLGRPLVYKPNHEYTKQIQRIVRFVTQGEIPDEPKKKGFFGFGR